MPCFETNAEVRSPQHDLHIGEGRKLVRRRRGNKRNITFRQNFFR